MIWPQTSAANRLITVLKVVKLHFKYLLYKAGDTLKPDFSLFAFINSANLCQQPYSIYDLCVISHQIHNSQLVAAIKVDMS